MHPIDSLEFALEDRGPSGVRRAIYLADLTTSQRIEFAALRWSWWVSHGADLADLLPGDVRTWSFLPPLTPSAEFVISSGLESTEVRKIPAQKDAAAWMAGSAFSCFEEQFKTSLIQHKLPMGFAYGIVGAFEEMASNAAEHAQSELAPVATYEVNADTWEFSVTDLGCGMLGSLRRNSQYRSLADDVAALRLALQEGVSATGLAQRGRGFACLFKALADRHCSLRFRSWQAKANWKGAAPGAGKIQIALAPPRRGFHVCVSGSVLARPA